MNDDRTSITTGTNRADGDFLGRRMIVASTARARVFGANSFSGVLDVVGGLSIIATVGVIVAMIVGHRSGDFEVFEHAWFGEAAVLGVGVTFGLTLMALSRIVLYAKACAVLLAGLNDAEA